MPEIIVGDTRRSMQQIEYAAKVHLEAYQYLHSISPNSAYTNSVAAALTVLMWALGNDDGSFKTNMNQLTKALSDAGMEIPR